jgi:hypothetical protein
MMAARCRLEGTMLSSVCLVVCVTVVLFKVMVGLGRFGRVDVLDVMLELALIVGLYGMVLFSGRSSFWTIDEAASGVRMERDGMLLYEGPISGLSVIKEDCGVMTLRAGDDGPAFLFPRRREFHSVLSRIAEVKRDG